MSILEHSWLDDASGRLADVVAGDGTHFELVEDTTFTPRRHGGNEVRTTTRVIGTGGSGGPSAAATAAAGGGSSGGGSMPHPYAAPIERFSTAQYSSRLQELKRRHLSSHSAAATTASVETLTSPIGGPGGTHPHHQPNHHSYPSEPHTPPSPLARADGGRVAHHAAASLEVERLRETLRQREQDVLYSVGLGQAILEDLCSLKKDGERRGSGGGDGGGRAMSAAAQQQQQQHQHPQQESRDRDREERRAGRALRKKFAAAAESFFNVGQKMIEDKAALLSAGVLETMQTENKRLGGELAAVRRARGQQDADAKGLSQHLRELQRDIEALEKERTARVACDSADLIKLAEEASKLRHEVNDMRAECMEKDKRQAEADLEIAGLRETLQGLRAHDQSTASLTAAVRELEDEADALRGKAASLAEDNSDLRADKTRLLDAVAAMRTQTDALEAKAAQLEQARAAAERARAEQAAAHVEALSAKDREQEGLRERAKDLQGRVEDLQRMLQEKGSLVDMEGRLKDLLTAASAAAPAATAEAAATEGGSSAATSEVEALKKELGLLGAERMRLLQSLSEQAAQSGEAFEAAAGAEREGDGRGGTQASETPPSHGDYIRHVRSLSNQIACLRVYVETEASANDTLRSESDFIKQRNRMLVGELRALRGEHDAALEDAAGVATLEREKERVVAENQAMHAVVSQVREDNRTLRCELQLLQRLPSSASAAAGVASAARPAEAAAAAAEVVTPTVAPDSPVVTFNDSDEATRVNVVHEAAAKLSLAATASPPLRRGDRGAQSGVSQASRSSSSSSSCDIQVAVTDPVTPVNARRIGVASSSVSFWESARVESVSPSRATAAVASSEEIACTLRALSSSLSPRRSAAVDGEHSATLRSLQVDIAASRGKLSALLHPEDPERPARECLATLAEAEAEGAAAADDMPQELLTLQRSHQQQRADDLQRVTEALQARLYKHSPTAVGSSGGGE